jgi:hypothetical protein
MTSGLIWGGVAGVSVGLLAYLAVRSKTTWALAKRIGVPLALGAAVGGIAGFGAKYSCESSTLSPSYRGLFSMGRVPSNVKCPKVPGISKAQWKKAIAAEMEHTTDRALARCIAAVHFQKQRRRHG